MLIFEQQKAVFLTVLCLVLFIPFASAQDTDGDGLLDLVDVSGFDPDSSGSGVFSFRGIADLDGASLLNNLQSLGLSYNLITSIESGDFDGLDNLQSLELRSNDIRSIERGDFDGLNNLQTLSLGANIRSIERGTFDGLANLQSLDLRLNDITSIESGTFDGLANLQSLELRASDFTSIERGEFDGLNNLQSLDLRFNDIRIIESGTFDGLANLQSLDLRFNDISELNFSEVTFNSLGMCNPSNDGLCIDTEEITSLLLDDAQLSSNSFAAIIHETTSITDVSLDGFTGATPGTIASLFGIETLDNVTVDPNLYSVYQAEFDAFAAIEGNRVTIVPEPSSGIVLLGMLTAGLGCFRRSRDSQQPDSP